MSRPGRRPVPSVVQVIGGPFLGLADASQDYLRDAESEPVRLTHRNGGRLPTTAFRRAWGHGTIRCPHDVVVPSHPGGGVSIPGHGLRRTAVVPAPRVLARAPQQAAA